MCAPRSEWCAIDLRVELQLKMKETLEKIEFEARVLSVGEMAGWTVAVLERSMQRKYRETVCYFPSFVVN
jgi:hypothetical protein